MNEIDRQYRLIKQMLDMHHSLKNHYRRCSLFAEVLLLSASIVFLLTTFADENFYQFLGLTPQSGKIILGLASAIAFLMSLILIILDWPGKTARHKDSAKQWHSLLSEFRDCRLNDKKWPDDQVERLMIAYNAVCDSSASIPDNKFNSLKSRYLAKVEISKLASINPGVPAIILSIVVRISAIIKLIRNL